jgi:CelD/BcsL family acetyltransferase involved in cellulose biosynthesis
MTLSLRQGALTDQPAQPAGLRLPPGAIIDGRDTSVWHSLAGNSYGSLFSSHLWVQAVAETYDFQPFVSVLLASGRPEVALPFCQVADLRGERIVCFPFCDYCDPLVDDGDSWRAAVAPVLARNVPVTLRCLRNRVLARDERFRVIARAAWHGIDLTRPEDLLWAGLRSEARNRIRRARASGLAVRVADTLNDIAIFYAMHSEVRKSKYRMLPQPFAFFERLHSLFGPAGQLTVLLAERDRQVVAGIFLIQWGAVLYYKFAASLDRSAAANDLLVWEAIRLGQNRGLSLFDFGASDLDQPGLLQFKRKYATVESEILRYYWEPPGYLNTRAGQGARILNELTSLLTEPAVPTSITQAAGGVLYGQFC